MAKDIIKVFYYENVRYETHQRYEDAEIEVFKKCERVIGSCETIEQIHSAIRYIELVDNNFRTLHNAFNYLIESKILDIRKELDKKQILEDLENINVIYEKVVK